MNEKLSNQRIFEIISLDKVFFRSYLKDYFSRLLNNNKVDQEDILSLFINFINQKRTNITPNKLLEFADLINLKFNKQGFRNYDFPNDKVYLYTPIKQSHVFQKYCSLLENYQGIWKDFKDLEKESFLHLHLMKIFPFIYNNELICTLILGSNLINSYYPPIMIDDNKAEYYQAINLGDALKLKEIIIKKAEQELKYLINFYKKYYLFPENISIEEIIIKKINY